MSDSPLGNVHCSVGGMGVNHASSVCIGNKSNQTNLSEPVSSPLGVLFAGIHALQGRIFGGCKQVLVTRGELNRSGHSNDGSRGSKSRPKVRRLKLWFQKFIKNTTVAAGEGK